MSEKEKVPYVVTSKSYTAVAINAASKAGEWIKSRLGTVSELGTKYSPQDLVTEVDKGAEQMIRRLILTHFQTTLFWVKKESSRGQKLPRER